MILDEITEYKKIIISDLKNQFSYKELEIKAYTQIKKKTPICTFYQAIKTPGLTLIAEVKKGSPSNGIIRENFDHIKIATYFEQQNARALSVLTDEKFFLGSNRYLTEIRDSVSLPLIRKDFILDKIQILESKAIGADAILLIAALLDEKQIESYFQLAKELTMDVLCEVHNEEELSKVLTTNCDIIGINNRNLKNFEVDVNTTYKLQKQIPPNKLIVCESGIKQTKELIELEAKNIDAVLIGTGLATNPELISYWSNISG